MPRVGQRQKMAIRKENPQTDETPHISKVGRAITMLIPVPVETSFLFLF